MSLPHYPPTAAQPLSALGFDFGSHRIGVAFGQTVTGTAQPLGVLKANDGSPDWDRIAQLLSEWQPSCLVVGLPYNLDGSTSELLTRATKFGHRLQGRFGLPVYGVDERLSTVAAIEQVTGANEARSKAKARTKPKAKSKPGRAKANYNSNKLHDDSACDGNNSREVVLAMVTIRVVAVLAMLIIRALVVPAMATIRARIVLLTMAIIQARATTKTRPSTMWPPKSSSPPGSTNWPNTNLVTRHNQPLSSQLLQALLQGLHSQGGAGLDGGLHLGHLILPNKVADGGGGQHNLAGGDAATVRLL